MVDPSILYSPEGHHGFAEVSLSRPSPDGTSPLRGQPCGLLPFGTAAHAYSWSATVGRRRGLDRLHGGHATALKCRLLSFF
jgi:hypothetical protein